MCHLIAKGGVSPELHGKAITKLGIPIDRVPTSDQFVV